MHVRALVPRDGGLQVLVKTMLMEILDFATIRYPRQDIHHESGLPWLSLGGKEGHERWLLLGGFEQDLIP